MKRMYISNRRPIDDERDGIDIDGANDEPLPYTPARDYTTLDQLSKIVGHHNKENRHDFFDTDGAEYSEMCELDESGECQQNELDAEHEVEAEEDFDGSDAHSCAASSDHSTVASKNSKASKASKTSKSAPTTSSQTRPQTMAAFKTRNKQKTGTVVLQIEPY